jgi:hypothetical protein
MTILLWLTLITGVIPFILAFVLVLPARQPGPRVKALISSSMLCTLAFNLTFFWQELWLVLAKAMTPGLHPTLFHNDHDWTGAAPQVELLQGVGALATLASGLVCLFILERLRKSFRPWRLFIAWMAFEGLFQSLSQVAIGALLPGNDVGRAFTFLGMSATMKGLALVLAVAGMATAGAKLARLWPPLASGSGNRLDRNFIQEISIPAAIAVILLIPFRLPRELVEVILVPLVVHMLGIGWTSLGAMWIRHPPGSAPIQVAPPGLAAPATALLAVLAAFQLVLARGIAF